MPLGHLSEVVEDSLVWQKEALVIMIILFQTTTHVIRKISHHGSTRSPHEPFLHLQIHHYFLPHLFSIYFMFCWTILKQTYGFMAFYH